MAGKAHHRGRHTRLAAAVVAAAYADVRTVCARCGLTLDEGRRRWGDAADWQAGHIVDGLMATSTADYRPEHAHCNAAAGAASGNRRRTRVTSRRWIT
jgi:hypothetical protein